jgi:predicted transcriptional regulator
MTRQVQQARIINEATGETMNLAFYQVKALHPYRHGGFIQMSQEALMELVKNPVSGESRRVLDLLCAVLDFENFIQVSQPEIGKFCSMEKQNVNRAIKELCERGILIRGAKVGRVWTYRLSPSFGFKGNSKNYGKLMRDISQFTQDSAQRDPNTIDLIDGVTDQEKAA